MKPTSTYKHLKLKDLNLFSMFISPACVAANVNEVHNVIESKLIETHLHLKLVIFSNKIQAELK